MQVIKSHLHISREMPLVKVTRGTEEDAKGVKPVTVQFEKEVVSTLYVVRELLDSRQEMELQ